MSHSHKLMEPKKSVIYSCLVRSTGDNLDLWFVLEMGWRNSLVGLGLLLQDLMLTPSSVSDWIVAHVAHVADWLGTGQKHIFGNQECEYGTEMTWEQFSFTALQYFAWIAHMTKYSVSLVYLW